MAIHIGRPRTDFEGLDDLEPLWLELHRHHLEVSKYQSLVQDLGFSWGGDGTGIAGCWRRAGRTSLPATTGGA
jgi:hypothetical protein